MLVGIPFLLGHLHVVQFLTCLLKTGGFRVVTDYPAFQIIHPFLNRSLRHLIELVDSEKEILWKDLFWRDDMGVVLDERFLLGIEMKHGFRESHSFESRDTVIDKILTVTQIEIKDADGIDFLDAVVVNAYLQLLSDGL